MSDKLLIVYLFILLRTYWPTKSITSVLIFMSTKNLLTIIYLFILSLLEMSIQFSKPSYSFLLTHTPARTHPHTYTPALTQPYAHTRTNTHTCTPVLTQPYAHTRTNITTRTHTYVHTHVHTRTNTHTCTPVLTLTQRCKDTLFLVDIVDNGLLDLTNWLEGMVETLKTLPRPNRIPGKILNIFLFKKIFSIF